MNRIAGERRLPWPLKESSADTRQVEFSWAMRCNIHHFSLGFVTFILEIWHSPCTSRLESFDMQLLENVCRKLGRYNRGSRAPQGAHWFEVPSVHNIKCVWDESNNGNSSKSHPFPTRAQRSFEAANFPPGAPATNQGVQNMVSPFVSH